MPVEKSVLLNQKLQKNKNKNNIKASKHTHTLRLLRGSRTSVISKRPVCFSLLSLYMDSPIILSLFIFPSAYRRNRSAEEPRSPGSRCENRNVSSNLGMEPFCTAVLCRCRLPGNSTTCTCQESMPLRALSGIPWAIITVTRSLCVSAR